MEQDIRLINLETGGNQAYIFASNKLRNVVGASELLYRVGTRYVEQAVDEATGRGFSVARIAEEAPIEATQGEAIEAVIATSGKALLLARGETLAKNFVQAWSRIVVKEAPGLDAVAVYSREPVDPSLPLSSSSKNSFLQAFRETSRQMTLLRAQGQASPLARFQRLPIAAECTYSGLPAVGLETGKGGGDPLPVSAPARAQRNASRDRDFKARMQGLFPEGWKSDLFEDEGLKSLEGRDWLAVVHADGNGLGQLFIDFDRWVDALKNGAATGRDYIDCYREFSSALDAISRETFREAVEAVWGAESPRALPIVPVVVGGDDLTAVMDGYKGIDFTRTFMEKFCEKTQDHEAIQPILEKAGLPRLGMCAGISIAKPHFPFSQSYHMAEELMQNAKEVKKQFGKDSIALDFHILYDSVATSVSDIRKSLSIREEQDGVPQERRLTAKPCVVSRGSQEKPDDAGKTDEEKAELERQHEAWSRVHDFGAFRRAVEALVRMEASSKKPLLSSSQAHAVRESLFSEHLRTQEEEWAFLMNTYRDFAAEWRKVSEDSPSLYVDLEKTGKDGVFHHYTHFLDALEAAKFEASEEQGKEKVWESEEGTA